MARLTLGSILPPFRECRHGQQEQPHRFVFLASSHERDAAENEARFGGPTADYCLAIVFLKKET